MEIETSPLTFQGSDQHPIYQLGRVGHNYTALTSTGTLLRTQMIGFAYHGIQDFADVFPQHVRLSTPEANCNWLPPRYPLLNNNLLSSFSVKPPP